MKKYTVLLTLITLFCLYFSNLPLICSENPLDAARLDPWLSMYHDCNLSGKTNTSLKSPLKEGAGYPIKIENENQFTVSSGFAIYNNMIFLQCNSKKDGEFSELRVYDLKNADLLWSTKVKGPDVSLMCPVIIPDLNTVFVAGTLELEEESIRKDGTFISAIDINSHNIKWTASVPGTIQDGLQYSQEAIYVRGIYIQHSTKNNIKYIDSKTSVLTKIDANNGQIDWSKKLSFSTTKGFGMVSASGDKLIISGCSYLSRRESDKSWSCYSPVIIQCFETSKGNILWEKNYPDYNKIGNISIDNNQVYSLLNKGHNDETYEVSCISLDLSTGEQKWEFKQKGFYGGFITPKFNEEFVFFAANSGYVFALNKENGKLKWSQQIKNEDYFINFQCSATLVTNEHLFLGGTQIVGTYTGGAIIYEYRSLILMLNLQNGRVEWKEIFDKDHPHTITSAVYGKGLIFLTQRNDLYYYESQMPELEVSPTDIDLGELEHGSKKIIKISVKNKGKKGLKGNIQVSDPIWMSVDKDIIDDNTTDFNLTINTEPLKLGPMNGIVKINSNGGNKAINVKLVVVDKTPPEILLNTDDLIKIEENYYTNKSKYELKGTTEPKALLLINEKTIELSENGEFKFIIELSEGKNEISIKATDQSGNTNEIIFTLYLDTTPPNIQIKTQNYKLCSKDSEYISGAVDDLKAILKINGENVEISPDGSFSKLIKLNQGINEINLTCSDLVGNITELKHYLVFPEKKLIILYIGEKRAEVNNQTVILDTPPMIIKGSTMVPLRFIGEAIGAELNYDNSEQKITLKLYNKTIILWINKTTALINNDPVSLNVPPIIVNGRTLVPVRFVSENLGAKVDWDGKLQKITITFPSD